MIKSIDNLEELKKIEPFSSLNMHLVNCTNESASLKINLDKNLNDKNTMFAGSIFSAMVLTGWLLAKQICNNDEFDYDVVVKGSKTQFARPVTSDCVTKASIIKDVIRKDNDNLAIKIVVCLFDETGAKCSKLMANYVGVRKL